MSDWKSSPVGDIADVQTGPFGSQLHREDYKLTGTPIITVEHLGDNRITYQNLPMVGDDDKERLSKYLIFEGDIVFSRVGSVDRRAYVSRKEDGWMFSGRLLRIRAIKEIINPRFLSYYFGQERVKEHIRRIAVGATMPSINTKILSEVEINYPPLPEQKAIAAVLSSLDDKIDLLKCQNQTLEALAETLFRQRFVEEAQYKWEDGCLGDLVELIYGKGLKKSIRTGEGFPVVGSRGIINFHSDYLVKAPGIVIGRKGTLGQVIYMTEDFYPIDTTYYIKSKSISKDLYFEYFLLKSAGFEHMNTDSAVPGLNRNNALSVDFVVPPFEVITKYNEYVHPLFLKINSNNNQIKTLEKLRDTLLPKLMSGEARVIKYKNEIL